LQGYAEGLRHADYRREAEVLSSGFEVPQERAMHLAVIRKFLLGAKTLFYSDFPDALPEAAQNVFHSPESLG
jgi:hypothetical protein